MNNADYLKRYLSKNEGKKKKKKVKCPKPLSGIIDDDVDINKLATTIDDEDDDDKPVEFVELLKKQKENISFANNWVACDETNDIKIEAPDNDSNATSTGFNFGAFKIKQEPLSPLRNSDQSPEQTEESRRRYDSDDDEDYASPPRRNERHDSDASPPRKTKGDADVSPPRRSRKYDSDTSPPRRPLNSDSSPPRRPKKQDADSSPPRKKRRDSDSSPPRRSGKHDSDLSPPRKSGGAGDRSRKLSNGACRRGRKRSSSADDGKRKRYDSSSDISPPRKSQQSSKFKTERPSPRHVKPEPTSPRPSTSRTGPKQDGKKRHDSDVESSADERAEVDEGPKVIIRDKLGRKVDENLIKLEEEKKKAFQEKYNKWGRGLKQKEMMEEMTKDFEKEASKPMARYADDVDLNEERKNVMHADDPMFEYMQRKKAKEASSTGKVRPAYKGPPAPLNRFNIQPGYRWDGVNRSNGFEVKFVLLQNEREAQKKEHYKWSTEDM